MSHLLSPAEILGALMSRVPSGTELEVWPITKNPISCFHPSVRNVFKNHIHGLLLGLGALKSDKDGKVTPVNGMKILEDAQHKSSPLFSIKVNRYKELDELTQLKRFCYTLIVMPCDTSGEYSNVT
jgi:hypothetical protein